MLRKDYLNLSNDERNHNFKIKCHLPWNVCVILNAVKEAWHLQALCEGVSMWNNYPHPSG